MLDVLHNDNPYIVLLSGTRKGSVVHVAHAHSKQVEGWVLLADVAIVQSSLTAGV